MMAIIFRLDAPHGKVRFTGRLPGHTREEAERRIAEAMANPAVPPDDASDDPPNPPIQATGSAGG